MYKIPALLRKTRAMKNLLHYMETEFDEVKHTTLNPSGPGSVRIHLVPPRAEENTLNSSVAVINGTDLVPVNFLWAVLLSELIDEINAFDGREITEADREGILDRAAESAAALVRFGPVPIISKKKLRADAETMLLTFTQMAYGEPVTAEVQPIRIGDYADHMSAPHRMDVMVSAMVKEGAWHCNQKCVHCYAAGQTLSDEGELSTDEWKAVLDRCRAVGIPQITFTGGEPTMRPDLPELVAHGKWFVTRVNTNGIRLTPDYCEQLRKAELDSMQITFYSADPAVHNSLVGAARHADTVEGIKNALAAGIPLSINTPLCRLNRDYVATLEYLHSLGIIYVTCSGLITTGNAATPESEALQLTGEELEEILRAAAKYCAENGMEIAFTSPGWIPAGVMDELNLPSPTCGACLSNMAITPGGNVVPCQSWLSEKPLGNMLRDDWETIWTSPECTGCRNFSAEMSGLCPLRRTC